MTFDRARGGQWKSTHRFSSSLKGRFTSLMIRFLADFIEGDDITNKRNLYMLHGGLGHGWAGYSQERERLSKAKALKRRQRRATALVRYYLQKELILFPSPADKKERTRHLILDTTFDLVTNALSLK